MWFKRNEHLAFLYIVLCKVSVSFYKDSNLSVRFAIKGMVNALKVIRRQPFGKCRCGIFVNQPCLPAK